jgi:hypothetical protein
MGGWQGLASTAQAYANRPTANSTAAIVIWLLGMLATKTFLTELGIGSLEASWVGGLFAFVFQAILSILEGPMWHSHLRVHRSRLVLGFGALVVDTALNTGGYWYFLQNLGNTTFWQAIATATNTSGGPSALTVLGLSVLMGLATSAGPEALWDL